MDEERERLRHLNGGLLRLHKVLLTREQRTWEASHGRVTSHDLLQLLLNDEHFAWLRSLSRLMADIDTLIDSDKPVGTEDAEVFFRQTYWLLKSGDSGAFHAKYIHALQESPDVVMAHAAVSKLLKK